jgi:hypothetical protein
MTAGDGLEFGKTSYNYSDLSTASSSEEASSSSVDFDDYFLQLQIEEEQLRRRRQQQLQRRLLAQDPLLDQEERNGRVDLPDWKVETNKDRLTVFSRNDRSDFYLPSPSRSKPRRSADLPGLSREVSSSENFNLYARNNNGEVIKTEKKLIRPQDSDTVLESSNNPTEDEVSLSESSREASSSTEDLLARLRSRQNEAVNESPSSAHDNQSSRYPMATPPKGIERVSDEAMRYVQAQTMNAGTRSVARENNSTSLNIYPRNKYGEPIVEKKRLVMPTYNAASVAASVLGESVSDMKEYSAYSQDQYEAPMEQGTYSVMAQKDTRPKQTAQQFLATTPNAGMAEILDMNRSKAYSLSSNARMAASIFNKKGDNSEPSTNAAPKKSTESYFAMSPANAFPQLQAKSKPVMARTKTAATAAKVLMTAVREEKEEQDDSGVTDKKVFFFRPDQEDEPHVAKKKSPVTVDNPFEYKQTLSEPEQRPSIARRAHLYAASMSLAGGQKTRGLSPGMVEGPPTQGQKIYAQGIQNAPQQKRGLSPGIVSGNSSSRQMVFARALVEPTDKESRGLAPGLVQVDQPFRYKQAISDPEHNPAQAQRSDPPKKRYVVNPGLLSSHTTPTSQAFNAGLDQPFQYKQVQTVPKDYENPAGIKPPVVPVNAMIPDSKSDAANALPKSDLLFDEFEQHENSESSTGNMSETIMHEDSYASMATNTQTAPAPDSDWEQEVPPQPDLVSPLDGSMAKGSFTGPSPEDTTVQIESGVLPVPIRRNNTPTPQQQRAPAKVNPINPNDITNQNLVDRPKKQLMSPTSSSMARAYTGISPEDATVQIESGVLPVPIRRKNTPTPQQQRAPVKVNTANPNDITNQSRVDRPKKGLMSPTSSSMARAYTGVSPEDATVQIESGVLPVPIRRKKNTPSTPQQQRASVQSNPANPNDITNQSRVDRPKKELMSPTSSSMARAYTGVTPEDAAHVESGVLSVPVPRNNSGASSQSMKEPQPQQKARPSNPNDITRENVVGRPVKNLVAHTDSSMAKAYSEIEDFVRVQSGVLSVPIKSRGSSATAAGGGSPHQNEAAPPSPANPNDITSQRLVAKPKKKLVAPTASSMARVDLAGPGDRPLPNPSGIISFPDSRPKTTAPPGIAQSSAMGLPRVTNPNEITSQRVVGRPKKKLVSPSSGSMAKAQEGPYTALPGEEPVSVTSNILSVPIRNRAERTPGADDTADNIADGAEAKAFVESNLEQVSSEDTSVSLNDLEEAEEGEE